MTNPDLSPMNQLANNQRELFDRLSRLETMEFMTSADPATAVARTISAFMMIPALRVFWPGTAFGYGVVSDLCPAARHLTPENGADLATDWSRGFMYMRGLVTPGHNFTVADNNEISITGTETDIATASRGFTLGCWVRFGNSGYRETFMQRWGASDNAFAFYKTEATSKPFINMDQTGAGTTTSTVISDVVVDHASWYFCVAALDPSTVLRLYVGKATDAELTIDENTSSIISSVNGSAQELNICSAGADYYVQGGVSMVFMAASFIPAILVKRLFAISKALYA